jgi:hypothetical protein
MPIAISLPGLPIFLWCILSFFFFFLSSNTHFCKLWHRFITRTMRQHKHRLCCDRSGGHGCQTPPVTAPVQFTQWRTSSWDFYSTQVLTAHKPWRLRHKPCVGAWGCLTEAQAHGKLPFLQALWVTLSSQNKSCCRQYVNGWPWLCPHKTLWTLKFNFT